MCHGETYKDKTYPWWQFWRRIKLIVGHLWRCSWCGKVYKLSDKYDSITDSGHRWVCWKSLPDLEEWKAAGGEE
jgi:uncharacterized C2H2 Zn-finger protein